MAHKPSSRRHKPLEPFDIDELMGADSMKGMLSFLEVPPRDVPTAPFPAPVAEPPVPETVPERPGSTGLLNHVAITDLGSLAEVLIPMGIPNEPGPTMGTQNPSVPTERIPSMGTHLHGIPTERMPIEGTHAEVIDLSTSSSSLGIPTIGIPSEGIPTKGIPNVAVLSALADRKIRPFPLRLAQEGHSASEQAVYEFLYRTSRSSQGVIRCGYGEIAHQVHLGRNTVIRVLRSLEMKLSIDRQAVNKDGSTYFVHEYANILKRRRDRGLTWAYKDRAGVGLLRTQDLEMALLGIPNEPSRSIPSGGMPIVGIPAMGTQIVPTVGIPGIPNEPAHLFRRYSEIKKQNDDDVVALEKLIRAAVPGFDRQACAQIWQQSTEAIPDTSPAEICDFFIAKWNEINRIRSIHNPNGMMLSLWRNYFTRAVVDPVRANNRQQKEILRAELQTELANPDLPNDLRELVAKRLEELN